MKRSIRFFVLMIIAFIGFNQFALADYPIVSHRFLADPGAMVYKDRVYLYCSNDNENPGDDKSGYMMKSIVCVSSSDLKNWTDHGIVFEVPKNSSWAVRSWAPAVVERDGKFFLYFGNSGNGIGVATSDSPFGPFVDPIGKPLVENSTPGVQPAQHMWLFDPMTFIDDDGQAYMYFGGNGDNNVRVIKLNRDMISVDGPAIALTAQNFFEASWMHKHNGKYYFSYSSNPRAEMRIDYMTCATPTSGFTYGGIVSRQPPQNDNNNHQAIFKLQGEWYQAYHNRTVAREAKIAPTYKRNLCVDMFRHNDDGTIEVMANTVDGVKQLGYVNPFERFEAETMNAQSGIATETSKAGGLNVCNIDNGDWIKVRGVDFGKKGARKFNASVAGTTPSTRGTIEICLDSPSGTVIGTCTVTFTGDMQNWKTISCKTQKVTGVHDLYLKFTGSEGKMFNFDWWQFSNK
ncbi:MAG TPA: glycoside hydrolase family 43 protein [Prolixibacteraceae bacterium]|nr:glycoside hydrolase family 43 protein [Prolixibacteraceae bacterium]